MNEAPRRAPRVIRSMLLALGLVAAAGAAPALAQQPTSAQKNALKQACRSDFQRFCAGMSPGSDAAMACLSSNAPNLSPNCRSALASMQGASSGAAGSAAPGAPAAAATAAATGNVAPWPHTVPTANGTATIYQPQVIAWPGQRTLETRMVIGVEPNGAPNPILGTIEVSFATTTDLSRRIVTLYDGRLGAVRFPSIDPAQAAQFEQRLRDALATMGPKFYPLDTILMSLPKSNAAATPAVALRNEPPTIFVASGNAALVVFDGKPVLAPIKGTPLSFAVNTNWEVFFDGSSSRWYLLYNGAWLAASDLTGPWGPAGRLPAAFGKLPNDPGFADVKKQIPGRTLAPAEVPVIYVSTTPAEIIVTNGPPAFAPIAGTSLQYVSNSDAVVFRDAADGRFYFLVSGRWFAAPALAGPWTFATANLPPEFTRIPANGPLGWVRASIPGTPEAEQALLEAQIPHQASLDRNKATLTVVYAGAPQFAPIPGTPLTYAVNTSFDVIRVGDFYYACYQGAWFVAPTPNGPWALATTVPDVIYTIPPESPLYRVTFVRIYDYTPTYVTYGYTSGYSMAYVNSGVVVYGTGWYYPPYVVPGVVPIYYPYPYSYAGAVYYNPATSAWARGGAIYGPYGGVAKAGTAYNPATGAWAHGGAVYGPYGGAGAVSAYNPSTGSYAHGSAVWGPDGGTANASWYNARTGVAGTTTQNANAYGRWGSSTLSGPNQTVHTQSASNAYGSAGSFSSTSGAKGAAVSGADGNTAGAVKTSSGNVYAGADGNVYKKTDDGWEKYDNGSWNQVQKPANETQQQQQRASTQSTAQSTSQSTAQGSAQSSGQSAAQSGQQRSNEASRSDSSGQLDQDHNARTQGGDRQRQWDSESRNRESGGGERSRSGGGSRGGRR